MNNPSDNITRIFSSALNFIFIKHPTRTSLGVILGIILNVLAKVFSPVLNRIAFVNLSIIEAWEYVVFGIFVLHIKTFYESFTKKTLLGENEERAFEIIRLSKEQGKITDWEAKNLYINLCERVLANVELKQSTKEELQRMVE